MKDLTALPPSVKLLTLINVAQARPRKRKLTSEGDAAVGGGERDWYAIARRAEKKGKGPAGGKATIAEVKGAEDGIAAASEELDDEDDEGAQDTNSKRVDSFEYHFGPNTKLVEGLPPAVVGVEGAATLKWKCTTRQLKEVGTLKEFRIAAAAGTEKEGEKEGEVDLNIYNPKLLAKLRTLMSDFSGLTFLQQTFLSDLLPSYQDVFFPSVTLTNHHSLRAVVALHAMNHVLKTRTKILKTNARLSGPDSTQSTTSPLDQGFTRPKILLLLPFRNSALTWLKLLTSLVPPTIETIENLTRFESDFALPEGAVDKLKEDREKYKEDHVETFAGNVDDAFRVGVKVNRKSVKLYSEFYGADIVVASPLGLRTSIEKEKDSDFLSSIEILIVDQMDVMLMQNFDHVQFILDRLNKVPLEPHGCDFSRVKPWYLDGKSPNLRQSILLSAYETPELRSVFNKQLVNVQGKVRVENRYEGIMERVGRGVRQVWNRFEVEENGDEDDERFRFFTEKTLPMILRSAVASSQTIIFVPSYFDFVRLKRYLKKLDDFSFASISEYSSTPDISRARGAFFARKVDFLVVTERFHFFRRYRLRGAQTFIFYAPPSHAHFYTEVLEFAQSNSEIPGQEAGVGAGEGEGVSVQVLFSRFDKLCLERIVGSQVAGRMIGLGDGEGQEGEKGRRFTFAN